MFLIEDESHAEIQGEYQTFEAAFRELEKRAEIPWNKVPNRCPCTNWKNCERNYLIIEYDTSKNPWVELQRIEVLNISAKGIEWLANRGKYK